MRSHVERQSLDGGREGGHVVEMQRRRLLLAFSEVLADVGLEGASVGRVCKRAGVSRRTFYDLFDDREACFVAVLDDAVKRIAKSVVPAYTGAGRWRERMRKALTVLLAFFEEEPAIARACLLETLKGGVVVSERRRRVLDALTVAVDEGRHEAKGVPPTSLTAESTVGGAVAVIQARLVPRPPARAPEDAHRDGPRTIVGSARAGGRGERTLLELVNPLMGMIVHPYLGAAAARRELEYLTPKRKATRNDLSPSRPNDPFKDLPIRITFRTARVLDTIGELGGRGSYPSNREVAETAGVSDQGQMSKLLRRLEKAGLIDNHGEGQVKGEPNAWQLTPRGQNLLQVVGSDTRE